VLGLCKNRRSGATCNISASTARWSAAWSGWLFSRWRSCF